MTEAADGGIVGLPRSIAIGCVLAATVLVVLDASIVNVALPAIAAALRVDPGASVRVVSAYQMALVMTLFPCAALGESLGYRRVYSAGVALFVVASALCSLAPSLAWLVAARFIQGLGGAAIMSLGMALLRFVVPQQQLAAAIASNTLAVALASAAGPTLGAAVLASASWPWLFAINLPIGVLVLFGTRALPRVRGSSRALDVLSVALNAGAFAALVLGAELLLQRTLVALLLLAAAVGAFFALVRRELPRHAPLVPLDLLRQAALRISVIASVCCFIGQSLAMLSLPFFLQQCFNQNVLQTGLLMTTWPVSVALVAPLAARLANHVSSAWLCAWGGVLLALGLGCAAFWPQSASANMLIPLLALSGAGFGVFQVSNNRNMFLSATRERSAAVGGMQSTARLTGQTLGAVSMSLLYTLTAIAHAARLGLGVAAVLTLVAGLVSTGRAHR